MTTGPAAGQRPLRRLAAAVSLRPEYEEQYLALHRDVWPGVRAAMTASNIENYSIFQCQDLLFSVCEYRGADLDTDLARLAADPVSRQWWALTKPMQERLAGAGPNEWWASLTEIYHQW